VTIAAVYCCIQGGFTGLGNIPDDPLFAGYDNYALTENSPCIDTADPLLPADPDGSPPDMGALFFEPGAGPTISFTECSDTAGLPDVQMQCSALVDFDLDGDDDLFGLRASDLSLLYYENQGGVFSEQVVPISSTPDLLVFSLRFLDYDHDGDFDLLGVDREQQLIRLYEWNAGGFEEVVLDVPRHAGLIGGRPRIVDFDRDGDPDIIYHAGNNPDFDLVLLRNSAGAFIPEVLIDVPADRFNGDFLVFDADLDGFQDVIEGSQIEAGCLSIGYRTAPMFLSRNDGGQGLLGAASAGLPDMCLRGALVAFDCNNDGWLDLANGTSDYICNGGVEKNWLLENQGGTSFLDVSDVSMNVGSHYYDLKHQADVDLDGDLDYFQQVETWTSSRLFLNNLDGTFNEVAEAVGLTYAAGRDGSADNYWLDLDADGDLDLLRVTRTVYPAGEGTVLLYRNETTAANWIAVRPIPRVSLNSLVGLRLVAHCGDLMMTRTVDDISSKMVHFGLGAHLEVDSLNVYWPSGIVTRLLNVSGGQVVTADEDIAVPTLLSWFNIEQERDVVAIAWQVSEGRGIDVFRLTASDKGCAREIDFHTVGSGQFVAEHRATMLPPDQEVIYQLHYQTESGFWRLVASETIRVVVPSLTTGIDEVFPNPFNPKTKLSFSVEGDEHVHISIYDMRGRQVNILVDQHYQRGTHSLEWTGKNATGHAVPSGTYFIRLETAGKVESRKVMLVR